VDDVPARRHLYSPESNADVQDETQKPTHQLICSEEKQRSKNDHNQNHGRRDHGLATRGPMNFGSFRAHLAQKRNGIGFRCHRCPRNYGA
jgi:hypothetical protein